MTKTGQIGKINQKRVVSLGDLNLDIITAPFQGVPTEEGTVNLDPFSLLPGGGACNFALETAALGDSVAIAGLLGTEKDPLSRWLKEKLEGDGVMTDTLGFSSIATDTLGITLALTYDDGTRRFLANYGTNSKFHLDDKKRKTLFRDCSHLHRSGYWFTEGLKGEPTLGLMREAQRNGIETSLDVATDPGGWSSSNIQLVKELLPFVNIFFANETELEAVAECYEPDLKKKARCLLERGSDLVVVHMGGKGSALAYFETPISKDGSERRSSGWNSPRNFTNESDEENHGDDQLSSVCTTSEQTILEGDLKFIRCKAFGVPEKNPTGTGDVFNASFVHARSTGMNPKSTLLYANAAAALRISGVKAYPSDYDVKTFLTERSLAV